MPNPPTKQPPPFPPMPDNRVTAPSIYASAQNITSPTPNIGNCFNTIRGCTVGQVIKQDVLDWGFKGDAEVQHELAHLILRLIGIQKSNGHFAPEYHVLALEHMMLEGDKDNNDLEEFTHLYRAYEKRYAATEIENRALMYLLRDTIPQTHEGRPDYASLWKECYYDHETLLKRAKKHYGDLELNDHMYAEGGFGWDIHLPDGTNYHYSQRNPEGAALPEQGKYFSMPVSATDAELKAMFSRVKPALDYITEMPEMATLRRDARRAYQREDIVGRQAQEKQIEARRAGVLGNIPVADLMEALGTEKLMVHKVGDAWREGAVDTDAAPSR